jgi:hypothetical protein
VSPILTGAPADARLQNVQAVTDFDVSAPQYPLIRLSADDFELLNYALFKVSAPAGNSTIWDSVAWMLRGADAGRDLVLFRAEKLVGVVQCKRLESPIALPDVLREIIKSILFTVADDSLPPIEPGLTYYLALASEAAGTVIDFFQRPAEILASRKADLPTYVREVIEKYDSLSSLDEAKAIEKIATVLPGLKLKLVRPSDLSLWLAEQTSVASRFFRYRVVVDSSEVGAKIDEFAHQMQRMQTHLEGVPFVTDVDLKIIRDRIEDTPETHRVAIGLATLFGFPREMFRCGHRAKTYEDGSSSQ